MSTWVLVANRTGARIFVRNERKLGLVNNLDHASGKRMDQDIEAGVPHRTFDQHGKAHHDGSSPHEHSAESFAKELAAELRVGRSQKHVDRIVLIAEPHFLGLVRHELDDATAHLVTASVAKDLVKLDVKELEAHVNEALPV